MLKVSLILGIVAALANVAGGFVLVRARGVEPYLRYFVALGAAFLMSAALLEMTPESLRLSPRLGPILIMAGYCVVHLAGAHHQRSLPLWRGDAPRRIRVRAHRVLGSGRLERALRSSTAWPSAPGLRCQAGWAG